MLEAGIRIVVFHPLMHLPMPANLPPGAPHYPYPGFGKPGGVSPDIVVADRDQSISVAAVPLPKRKRKEKKRKAK
jgi:hypothetical protein